MFIEQKPGPERLLIVAAGGTMLGLFLLIFIVSPVRGYLYRRAHPEFYGPFPDCSKFESMLTFSPGGKYAV